MAGTNHLWSGLDPVEPGPQPSRPTPAYGAPDIGQRQFKEDSMLSNQQPDPKGDHSANGGYGHDPLPPLPNPQPAK
jgi:hypothetical protein